MNYEKRKHTVEQAQAFQSIFDYFNDTLFASKLPQVILNFSRSGARTVGFYKPNTWTKQSDAGLKGVGEISLSPKFLNRDKEKIFSTLVHEQCHLWQEIFGQPSRSGYHNREWAEQMKKVGLQPISNSSAGGETGQSCHHEIISGGVFAKAFEKSKKQLRFHLLVLGEDQQSSKPPNRAKYICEECKTIVYGKFGLKIICGICNSQYKISQ